VIGICKAGGRKTKGQAKIPIVALHTRAEPIEARNEPTMHEQGRGKETNFTFLKKNKK
jgi:hypothetical protein